MYAKARCTHQSPVRGMPRSGSHRFTRRDQRRPRRVFEMDDLDDEFAVLQESASSMTVEIALTHSETTTTLSPALSTAIQRIGTAPADVTNPSNAFSGYEKLLTLPSADPVRRREGWKEREARDDNDVRTSIRRKTPTLTEQSIHVIASRCSSKNPGSDVGSLAAWIRASASAPPVNIVLFCEGGVSLVRYAICHLVLKTHAPSLEKQDRVTPGR